MRSTKSTTEAAIRRVEGFGNPPHCEYRTEQTIKLASARFILVGIATSAASLLAAVPASPQQRGPQTVQQAQALAQRIAQQTAQKPLMAEEVFKNVQILKGIPVNQFMDTMGFFAASLG